MRRERVVATGLRRRRPETGRVVHRERLVRATRRYLAEESRSREPDPQARSSRRRAKCSRQSGRVARRLPPQEGADATYERGGFEQMKAYGDNDSPGGDGWLRTCWGDLAKSNPADAPALWVLPWPGTWNRTTRPTFGSSTTSRANSNWTAAAFWFLDVRP